MMILEYDSMLEYGSMRVGHDAAMRIRLHAMMTHEPMQCMRISMRVCEHDTNTPPSGNYFPL